MNDVASVKGCDILQTELYLSRWWPFGTSLLGDLSPLSFHYQHAVVVLVHVPQHQRVQTGLVKTAIQFGGNERASRHLHAAGLARAHVSTVFQSSI
jgi:hypothetical protein